ncbi:hypothetical protein [Micromonospora sp. NPDC003776]
MSIRVDSAVRRPSWITFGPQLTLDDSLGHPPRSEQQATRLEYNLAARSRFSCHVLAEVVLLTPELTDRVYRLLARHPMPCHHRKRDAMEVLTVLVGCVELELGIDATHSATISPGNTIIRVADGRGPQH